MSVTIAERPHDPDRLLGLRGLLACPACRGELVISGAAQCSDCGAEYEESDGVLVLLPSSSLRDRHKRNQAESFDVQDPEFEEMRPQGSPALYGWTLEEKFRRGASSIRPFLEGGTAITVCGGSGMDAEFLARAGAAVITADVSPGASARAARRAQRLGLPILAIVADAERLPLADRAVDVAYVHDGLHHLQRPRRGVREMARVAARAVSVNEPADAALTQVAVRAGLATNLEDAGNPVARLDPVEVEREFERDGLRPRLAHRYAMYYRHAPGPLIMLMSRPRLRPAATLLLRAGSSLLGPVGNKMTVQAVREKPKE